MSIATSNIATTTAFKFAVATKRGGKFFIIATIKNGVLCQSRLSTASEVTGEFVVTPFCVSGLREGYVWYSRCKTLYTRNRKVVDNVLFTGGKAETVATKFIWYNDSYVESIPTSAYSNLERDIFSLEEKALEKILELLKQDDLWFSPSCQTVFKRGELCDFSEFKIN